MSDVRTKLAEARAAKEKREAARASKAEEAALATLELEAALEKEHGPRGHYFELVETVEGPIAVKLGEAVLHTRFIASKAADTDVHEYVFPCVVHPSKDEYLAIVARRPGIQNRVAHALMTLFGAKATDDAGKF